MRLEEHVYGTALVMVVNVLVSRKVKIVLYAVIEIVFYVLHIKLNRRTLIWNR